MNALKGDVVRPARPELPESEQIGLLSIRLDRLILGAALLGGLALVAADIFQRWIWPDHIWVLDIDGRFNTVTWFHSFVLAGASLAALALAFTYQAIRERLMWLFVGASLAFLSLDKSISLHERVGQNIEEGLDLPEQAGRLIWEIVYAPFLASLAILMLLCVRNAGLTTRFWIELGLLCAAAKILVEGVMFPMIEWGWFDEQSVVYGLEVNIEESVQLLGFALFFGAFAQLLLKRIVLAARGDLEVVDAAPRDTSITDLAVFRVRRSTSV
jgi:hypothetical protein